MTLIATFFPNRRPADIKNRYYYHLGRGTSACSSSASASSSQTDAVEAGSTGEVEDQPTVEMAIVQPQEPARPETLLTIDATPSDFGWVDLCGVDDSLFLCYAEMDSVDAFSFW